MRLKAMIGMVIFASSIAMAIECTSASAAPAWLTPTTMSVSGTGVTPVLGTNPEGDAAAVWWGGGGALETRARATGTGSWSESMPLVAPGQHNVPAVALDGQGDAVAVWQSGVEEKIEGTFRSISNGLWGTPVVISPEGVHPSEAQVATDTQGDVVAVWSDREGATGATIEAAVRSPITGDWEPASRLSEVGEPPYRDRSSLHPVVAVGSEGEAVAVWEDDAPERVAGAYKLIEAAVKPSNGVGWEPPVVLGTEGRLPQVAMSSRGDAVAVWPGAGGLYAATLPVSSRTWQATVPIVTTEVENPRLALDANGDAVAVWESVAGGWGSTPGTNTVEAAVKLAGGAWGSPTRLSESVEYSHLYPTLDPRIAITPQGSAIAVWDGYTPTAWSIQGAVLPAVSDSWQQRVQIAETGGVIAAPSLGVDEHGNGVVLWEGREGNDHVVETIEYDASSPVLEGVSVPSAGVAGKALSFAASPLEVSAALGQTSWNFGDGTPPVTGASVSHAYALPGTYRVTVSTADVFGNVTSASRTLQVSPTPLAHCRCQAHRPPKLSDVRLTNRRFRVAGQDALRGARRRSAVPLGTTFHFKLSESATVQIRIVHTVASHRRDHGCRSVQAHCDFAQSVATVTYREKHMGNDTIYLRGRVDGRVLSAGRYIAIITAYNRLGRSTPVRVSFTVIRYHLGHAQIIQ